MPDPSEETDRSVRQSRRQHTEKRRQETWSGTPSPTDEMRTYTAHGEGPGVIPGPFAVRPPAAQVQSVAMKMLATVSPPTAANAPLSTFSSSRFT